jgi:ArsR family transcriptional regulator
MPMRQRVVEDAAAVFAAMGHPTRLRVLALLHQREHDATQLATALGLSPSNVSQHLALLRNHHLVTVRREGTHVHYALRDARVGELLDRALDLLADDAAHARDVERAISLVRRGRV